MPFEKGHEGIGGRPPGSKNKLSLKIKEAIEAAFDEVGGVDYLTFIARKEPTVFCALLGKLLPKDITVDAGQTLEEILNTFLKSKGKPE